MDNSGNVTKTAIIVISAYIAAQMIADIASLKIGVVFGLAVDMGTFIYPFTFTLRDAVHKVAGKKNSQVLILTAGGINLLMAAYLMFSAVIPSDRSWGLGNEFSSVLSPVWRIVISSIIAEIISELVDTELYHWFVVRITKRFQWCRVLVSNSLSIPIDNAIFSIGAFGFLLPWSVVGQIFMMNLFVKYAVTLFSLPMIYMVPETGKSV